MAKKTNIICKNNFKNSDPEAIKEAFNKKMAQLICRAENLTFKNSGERTADCSHDQKR